MIRGFSIAVLVLFLCGCDNKGAPLAQPAAIPPQTVHVSTPDEWKAALLSTYTERDVKDKGDGVTTFTAVFKSAGEPVRVAFGSRDAFRKLRFYIPGIYADLDIGPYLKTYISLSDNGSPLLFLAPYYFGKNGWLFMSKVSVMVDGDVVLERDFQGKQVNRNAHGYGVEERYDFIASDDDIAALRKISSSSKVLIRLTGSKGYVNLGGADDKNVQREIIDALAIYDRMSGSLNGHIPPQ